jgi:hypothetical protein
MTNPSAIRATAPLGSAKVKCQLQNSLFRFEIPIIKNQQDLCVEFRPEVGQLSVLIILYNSSSRFFGQLSSITGLREKGGLSPLDSDYYGSLV